MCKKREIVDLKLILTHSSFFHLPFFSLWRKGKGHEVNITLNSISNLKLIHKKTHILLGLGTIVLFFCFLYLHVYLGVFFCLVLFEEYSPFNIIQKRICKTFIAITYECFSCARHCAKCFLCLILKSLQQSLEVDNLPPLHIKKLRLREVQTATRVESELNPDLPNSTNSLYSYLKRHTASYIENNN